MKIIDRFKTPTPKFHRRLRNIGLGLIAAGGAILAQQTNIALDHITGDWGFYIQGDEALHEKYLDVVLEAMKINLIE